jgi:hypothetical protein
MAGVTRQTTRPSAGWPALPDMRPWGRRPLTIPPNSANAWIQFAIWEIWMGILIAAVFGLGAVLIAMSPSRIVAVPDLTNCYAVPPVLPCERLVYQGGILNAAFTVLFGLTLVGAAAWLLWELWSATEPKPITDDFLRLLNDSFGRSWRNPLKWPWARIAWAYGFTLVGVTLSAGLGIMIWTLAASRDSPRAPTIRIDTSQSFRLDQ